MLKLTWTIPCSSHRSYLNSGIHREVPPSYVSTLSQNKVLKANQLGLLLSLRNRSNSKMDKIVRNSVDPGASSGGAPWNSWQGLIFGVVVVLILPFSSRWGPFLAIKNRVGRVLNNIETVAEVTEIVAKKVDAIADDIAEKLPDDGQLKKAVLRIGKIAEETAKDAHAVDTIIEEVEDADEKVESLLEDQAVKQETENVEVQAPKEETKNVEHQAPEEDKKDIVEDQAPSEEKKNTDTPNT